MIKARSGHPAGCSSRQAAEIWRLRRSRLLLQRQVQRLEWDEPFGMLTRNAFLERCQALPPGLRQVAFIDLNEIGEMNHRFGYTEVDRRIKEAFSIFSGSEHVVARWYSGDEIAILFAPGSNPEMLMSALAFKARRQGLSFFHEIAGWNPARTSIELAMQELSRHNSLYKLLARQNHLSGGSHDESRVHAVGRSDGDVNPQRFL